MTRRALTNAQRAIIERYCLRKSTDPGQTGRASRQFIEAVQMPGQAHDLREADRLARDLSGGHLLVGRAFDADCLRNDLLERGIIPIEPPKSNRKFPATFDKEPCKWQHLIENDFGKLKENRGIAMRPCKTAQSFKAFLSIAATIMQIR